MDIDDEDIRHKNRGFGPKFRCKKCKTIIQSKHVHHMVWCKCQAIAVDGGNDYVCMTGDVLLFEDVE